MSKLASFAIPIGVIAFALSSSAQANQALVLRGTGAVSALAPSPGDRVAVARRTLSEREPSLRAIVLVPNARHSVMSGGYELVRFAQQHDGLPVFGRGAALLLGKTGAPTVLGTAHVEHRFAAFSGTPLGADFVARLATRVAGIDFESKHTTLGWFPLPGGARLAYVVYRGPAAALPYAPLLMIDAQSGRVILRHNAVRFDRGATIFESNPVTTPTPNPVTLEELAPGATTLESERVTVVNCIDRQTTKEVFNTPIHTCELVQTATADAQGDFPYSFLADNVAEDAFAEVNMFYHVSRAYSYYVSIGMPELATRPLPAIVNLRFTAGLDTFDGSKMSNPDIPLVPFDNAFYAPENPFFARLYGLEGAALWFGQGTSRDFSYDGDVVYHELGHALVDNTAELVGHWHLDEQGASMAPGGMNEGLADFFSSAITGDPRVGEYVAQAFSGDAIRDISDDDVCPANLAGEPHMDATLFSAGLWEAREATSEAERSIFDSAIVTGLIAAPSGDLGYEELAEILVTAVEASPLGAARAAALRSSFETRGVLPNCKRVREHEGFPMESAARQLGGAFVAPGLRVVPVEEGSDYAPGLLQIHATIDAGAERLKITWLHVDPPSDGFTGGGGGGTPYEPAVLARFADDPIAFDYTNGVSSNAGEPVLATSSGPRYTASVDIPADAKNVFVMIVNRGEDDGMYTQVELTQATAPSAGGGGGSGGSSGKGSGGGGNVGPATGGSSGTLPADPSSEHESLTPAGGCGCRFVAGATALPFGSGSVPSSLGLVALLALPLLRRRRH